MGKKFTEMRFYLFCNSYSGNKLANHIIVKNNNQKSRYIRRLTNILGFKYKQTHNFVIFGVKPELPYQRVPHKLKIYLEVEKELLKLSEEKLDEYSTAIEDYQNQLLYPAIERAVGNFLTDIKNDDRFQILMEEKFKKACYIYYKVVYKYKLPTLRTVSFVLRLIT